MDVRAPRPGDTRRGERVRADLDARGRAGLLPGAGGGLAPGGAPGTGSKRGREGDTAAPDRGPARRDARGGPGLGATGGPPDRGDPPGRVRREGGAPGPVARGGDVARAGGARAAGPGDRPAVQPGRRVAARARAAPGAGGPGRYGDARQRGGARPQPRLRQGGGARDAGAPALHPRVGPARLRGHAHDERVAARVRADVRRPQAPGGGRAGDRAGARRDPAERLAGGARARGAGDVLLRELRAGGAGVGVVPRDAPVLDELHGAAEPGVGADGVVFVRPLRGACARAGGVPAGAPGGGVGAG
jgi:translation initiation factor IF-2